MEINNLDDYQRLAITTAIYPKTTGVEYLTLGLVGEISETINKFDINDLQIINQDILDEIGDIMWYLSVLSYELNIKNSELEIKNIHSDNLYLIFAMAGAGGEIANKVKKMIRDDLDVSEIKLFIMIQLGLILSCINSLSKDCLLKICEKNIEKLQKRKEKGVLGGSGDKR